MTKKNVASHAARGKLWVTKHYPGADEQTDEQEFSVHDFEVEPAWVKAGYGLTINLGNYESARCDVGVTLPTYVEEIPAAFEEAWKLAKAEIKEQTKDIKKH
jgi:hypothetical protein